MLSYSGFFSKNWHFLSAMHLTNNNTPFFFKSFQKTSKSTFSKTRAKLKYYACNKTFFSPQKPDYQYLIYKINIHKFS
ncbi:hypothetical protein SAMN05216311_11674 [Chitinophaga sp. CF418]|nr:hypothetical protein SAMN05216311_11674 [Chitinophaga sp. CF418]